MLACKKHVHQVGNVQGNEQITEVRVQQLDTSSLDRAAEDESGCYAASIH